jgi:hypothetical protein
MRHASLLALLATALGCALFAMPAQAARARVFVASYGSDSNPCTFGSPCKTFQNAFDAVDAGGEITAIDSAGFGPLMINHAITVTSPAGVEAGIAANPNSAAITIDAGSTDVVSLHGLTLEGGGTGGYFGIVFNSGAKLDIVDCVIRDYIDGISIQASTAAQVTIKDTYVSNNNVGIALDTTSGGTGELIATLDHVTVTDNTGYGVTTGTNTYPVLDTIENSDFSHNGIGIVIASQTANYTIVNLFNVDFNDHSSTAYLENYSILTLSHVNDTNSTNGINVQGSSTISSDGTSHVTLSGPDAPGTLGSYPFK